jgi:hypothetical protein
MSFSIKIHEKADGELADALEWYEKQKKIASR